MSHSVSQSRRHLLQFMASAPVLSLPGMALAHGHEREHERECLSVTFNGMPAPSTIEQKATTYVGSSLTVNFKDGGSRTYPLSYQPFFLTGDLVPDGHGGEIVAGGYFDIHQQPIIDNSVAANPRQMFSDSPDGTSLLKIPGARVPGVKGHTVFAVVQFEYATYAQDGVTSLYGTLPSPIAVLTLDQNKQTGELKLVKYHNVDTSAAHGLWITCGASLSPWGTHLSSEEYEPDPRALPSYFAAFEKNLGVKANPYHYGHLPEVTVHPDGTGTCRKHYCLGRISHEVVRVMPDSRT
ncbi:MAG TPA: alkaline phosphatase PhoX, partial [Aquabacterium sp.]|nr:alkaline phosphatase PhoX [Aquabacterium sp.]